MVDLLLIWGVTNAVGFVFKPILEDLAKDAAKDFVKDFFKDSLKHVLLPEKDPREVATGKAIKEFLQLVQQQLEVADLSEAEQKQYTEPLKQFLKNQSVKEVLRSAFKDDCEVLDTKKLEQIWNELHLLPLPDNFGWKQVTKPYLQRVKAIIQESPKLRAIINSQNIEAIKDSTKELAGIVPEFDLLGYQEAIRERYGRLNLQSLGMSDYVDNDLEVQRIFILPNVRKVLKFFSETPKEGQRQKRDSNQLEKEISLEELKGYGGFYFDLEQTSRTVLDIVNDYQHYKYVVILGNPGSGKSILLQFLALNWAKSPLNNAISLPIPLLIELRTYIRQQDEGHCKDFLEFFHQAPGLICHLNQHQLHEHLKTGKAIVMFDGLDEVFEPAKREDMINDIHRFTNKYPNVQVIVTSRVIGYKSKRLKDAEFCHFMLQDLEPEQIKDFILRWHELTFDDEADKVRKRERLQRAIETSKSLGELAGNPLLLTMMAILNRNRELPKNRPELYEKFSKVLLHEWDNQRNLREKDEEQRLDLKMIDYQDKQAMLGKVASYMQANNKGRSGNLISKKDLVYILTEYLKTIEVSDARHVARYMADKPLKRSFILCFLGADSYAFEHRTFLEYFCAWEFVERLNKRGLEGGLTLEELKTEVFGKHWYDESWHEVLRLIVGMIDTRLAGQIIDYLMDINGKIEGFTNVFLACKCLYEVRERRVISATTTRVLDYLKEELLHYRKPLKLEEINLEITVKVDIFNAFNRRYSKLNRGFNTQVVSEIATIGRDEPDTLVWLKTCAQSNKERDLRWVALEELVKGWKDDPETLSFLKTRVHSDVDEVIRGRALQELARVWKDNPDTLDILKNRACEDESWFVRQTALQQLAIGWKEKDEPDLFEFLKNRSVNDEGCECRQAVIKVIIEQYPDDSKTLSLLRDRAENDPDVGVQVLATQALAKGWKDEPGMFEFLCDLLVKSFFSFEVDQIFQINPRPHVFSIIIEQYPDHPQILSLLRDHAENDPYEEVRVLAQQALDKSSEPNSFEFLYAQAVNDEGTNCRKTALIAILQKYSKHPQTLELLRDRAKNDPDGAVREFLVEILVRVWKKSPEKFEFLCNRATNDPYERPVYEDTNPRHVAIQAIIQEYPKHPKTLELLRDRAKNDSDGAVRMLATQALVEDWKDEPDLFEFLCDLAVNDPDHHRLYGDPLARQIALEKIIEHFLDHPQTLPLLHDRAENDQNSEVRCLAVQGLAKGWKDDPETLPLIKCLAQSDQSPDVRAEALQKLAQGWKDEPGMLEFLCDRAINDPLNFEPPEEHNPRLFVLSAIIEQYPDHPQTLSLLRDRAENDPDPEVQQKAVQVLAKDWKDEPDIFDFLCTLFVNGSFSFWVHPDFPYNPRPFVFSAIIEQYPDHPQTLSLLRDRADNDPDKEVRELAREKLAELAD